ncbi:hypothetical protein N7457_001400 [Penicillium paradoxum]|uniref:uncharacterized protein n=1 Tax=Penicillium paradoxum TaxID=176176 RepID=UPI00254688E9|nr:uncharacterized protein N7457_001400 [Penicillium paradoxum]KAJ5794801.1 hypothetical protein N7457_001400 [Penicillium paradoxum]
MSDSASVYEPDDDAESESDFEPARPSRGRSLAPTRERTESTRHNDRAVSAANGVGQELGHALMARTPPMRGPLTFVRAYRHLLAESEEAVEYATLKDPDNVYKVSQHGSVVWTSTEKQLFFSVLERKGKGGIKELVAAIGTKSELEVIEYIRFLHKALEAQCLSDKHVERMPVLSDIPAAMELSQECCDLLEDYGDILVFQDSLLQTKAGTKKHGDNWIVTSAHAQRLVDAEDTARGDLRLAAGLLNLPEWIRLSQTLLMNFGGSKADDNWWRLATQGDKITAEGHTASMTAEGAVDFYSLAVSITRRLVQSSIFFSMSRVRSASRTGRDRKRHVRTQDVRAAIEVLNMKHRRPNFVDIARRNEIVIEDILNRKGWVSTVFSYDEAEEIIDKNEWFRYRKDGTISRKKRGEEVSDDDDAEDDEEMEDDQHAEPESEPEPESEVEPEPLSEVEEEEDDEDDDDSLPTRESSELSSPVGSSDELGMEMDPEEEQADIADQNISRSHEANLRRLMDQPLPSILNEITKAEDTETENKPQLERRTRQDISNWRDRTLYRSEWEEYGYDFADLKDELEMPPPKRPRLDEPTPASVAAPGEDPVDNKNDRPEPQQATKGDEKDQGPSGGQSWVEYYMTQFGKPGNTQ